MKQLLFFCISGGVGFLVDAGVLYALIGLGLNPYAARVVSFLCAVFATYLVNSKYTFSHVRGQSRTRQAAKYLLAMSLGGACNYAAYAAMLAVLPHARLSPLFALMMGSFVGLFVNFASSKFWVFKHRKEVVSE